MLKRLIRAIRKKPKAVRDQYAFWIAAIFTGSVFFIWLATFTTNIESIALPEVEPPVEERGSLTDMMSGLREDLTDLTPAIQSSASSTATTTASSTPVRIPTTPSAPQVRIATFTASSTL